MNHAYLSILSIYLNVMISVKELHSKTILLDDIKFEEWYFLQSTVLSCQ